MFRVLKILTTLRLWLFEVGQEARFVISPLLLFSHIQLQVHPTVAKDDRKKVFVDSRVFFFAGKGHFSVSKSENIANGATLLKL